MVCLHAQKKPVDQQLFLAGLEVIATTPQLAKTQAPLVEHVFEQLSAADLKSWPQAELAEKAVRQVWSTVKMGNQALHLPRSALEEISPKLKALLNTGMREAREHCILLEAPENANLAGPVLSYLGTDRIFISGDNVMEVLKLSCQHRIEPLTKKCVAFIEQHLCWDTFGDILEVAIEENLPWLKFHCLIFAQNHPKGSKVQELLTETNQQLAEEAHPENARRLDQKKHLLELPERLNNRVLYLSLSPEGQPGVWTYGCYNSALKNIEIEVLKDVNRVIPICCFIGNGSLSFEEIAAALPDLEELVPSEGAPTQERLFYLQQTFPKLRSFGSTRNVSLVQGIACYTQVFTTFDQIRDYLELFAAPGKEAAATGRLRLRALNLDRSFALTPEQFMEIAQYFNELYWLEIHVNTEVPFELDLPKATTVRAHSRSVAKISAKNARSIVAQGNPNLVEIDAPNANGYRWRWEQMSQNR